MTVTCQAICDVMECWGPRYLAEDWDNVGLQVGNPKQSVQKVLVSLDISGSVMQQAIEQGANMIIAHHPLIFRPIKQIRSDTVVGHLVMEAVRNEIAIFAGHTNFDVATNGVNDLLAASIGLQSVKVLQPSYQEKCVKLVVFVPVGYEDAVRDAMSNAGAGYIGNYSHCTFQSAGEGTFLPREGSRPFCGDIGSVERVAEYRIETIVPEHKLKHIVAAMQQAHPYEEVAFDVIPLHNRGATFGLGRIGVLSMPVSLRELAILVKRQLGCDDLRFVGSPTRMMHTVAVCGGSGAGFIDQAIGARADVLITGDIKYHEAQEAAARGLCLIDAGHFSTERMLVPAIADYLTKTSEQNNWGLEIITAEESNIFKVL